MVSIDRIGELSMSGGQEYSCKIFSLLFKNKGNTSLLFIEPRKLV